MIPMRLRTVGILAALAAAAAPAFGQAYPERSVSMIVAFPAGGATDHMARLLAQRMTELWGQPVVVINRAGAGGNIGAEAVVRSAPDGHTLLIGTTALAISPSLYKTLSYDVLKDLAPVTQLTVTPNVLVVHPSVPAASVQELIDLARRRPGSLVSASAGPGTSNHMAFVLFSMLTRTDILHVPYKGAAPALTAVVGGEGAMTFVPINAAIPLVKSHRLRALAVTTEARAAALPQIPTIAESGVKGYAASSWTGVLAPAAIPAAIVGRIHATIAESVRSPKLRDAMQASGLDPVVNTPQQFAQSLREEIAKWAKVVKAAGLAVQ
jgi:tripartite-type tricarboxylate transporter receptor subunit TctC